MVTTKTLFRVCYYRKKKNQFDITLTAIWTSVYACTCVYVCVCLRGGSLFVNLNTGNKSNESVVSIVNMHQEGFCALEHETHWGEVVIVFFGKRMASCHHPKANILGFFCLFLFHPRGKRGKQ